MSNSHKIHSSFSLSPQQKQWMTSKILNDQQLIFTSHSQQLLHQFVLYIQELPINKQSLGIIKMLIKRYGLTIVVFLNKFYQKLDDDEKHGKFVRKQGNRFKKLAAMVKQEMMENSIKKIEFIYKYGCAQKQKNENKQIKIQKIKFIQAIIQMQKAQDELKNQINKTNVQEKIQQYKQIITNKETKWKSQKVFDNLMIKSLKRYVIPQQQLKIMFQKISEKGKKVKKYVKKNASNSQQKQNQESIYSISTVQKPEQKSSQSLKQVQSQSKTDQKILQKATSFQKSQQSSSDESQNQNKAESNNTSLSSDNSMNIYRMNQSSIGQICAQSEEIKKFMGSEVSNNKSFLLNQCDESTFSKGLIDNNESIKDQKIEMKKKQHKFSEENSVTNQNDDKSLQISKSVPFLFSRSQLLCCRRFFIYQQEISQKQSLTTAFIHASFPFHQQNSSKIKRTICSMLNHDGGNIYIGIVNEKNKYLAIGHQINEGVRQVVLRTFRKICQCIDPDILMHKMYAVQFVPVKQKTKTNHYQYIPGTFVIKITVKYGIRDQIYSYKQNGVDYFPFRQENTIIYKEGRELLKLTKERMQNPLQIPQPIHPYPCQKPQIGQLLNQYYEDPQFSNRRDEKFSKKIQPHVQYIEKSQKERIKQAYKAHKKNLSPEKHSKSKQKENNKSPRKSNKPIVHYDGIHKLLQIPISKPEQKQPHQNQQLNSNLNLINQLKPLQQSYQGYFYVIGATQNQLLPALQKKNLTKIKFQQYDKHHLVLKAFDLQSIIQLRKFLKRVQQKYKQHNIKFYQISLQIKFNKQYMARIMQYLKNTNIRYQYKKQENVIKFYCYRESLETFIEMKDNQIQGKFVNFVNKF